MVYSNDTHELQGLAGLRYRGEYGQICDDGQFEDAAAKVLCHQMGYTSGTVNNGSIGTHILYIY